jgi:hypothetical protein
MSIAHSTFSRALTYEGNRVRETMRLNRRLLSLLSEDGWYPLDGENMSLSASELDSASLRPSLAVKLPELWKPATDREEMSICTCRVIRGGWRRRVLKERRGIPGDPFQCLTKGYLFEQGAMGINNRCVCWQRESERSILALKRSNVRGAKGPYFNCVSIYERRSA